MNDTDTNLFLDYMGQYLRDRAPLGEQLNAAVVDAGKAYVKQFQDTVDGVVDRILYPSCPYDPT
jgi:hypothetical protein